MDAPATMLGRGDIQTPMNVEGGGGGGGNGCPGGLTTVLCVD